MGFRSLSCAVALASLAAAGPKPAELTGAIPVEARLLTGVSSYRTKTGAEIEALVVISTSRKNHLPAGSVLRGHVGKVKKVGLGLIHESATIELNFGELTLPDGRAYPVESRVVGVDNARERVDRRGCIHGPRVTDSLSHRFGARIAFAAFGHPLFIVPALAVESGVLRLPEPEIGYHAGTELELKVRVPDSLALVPAAEDTRESAAELEELRQTLDGTPYWSYSKRQRRSMDLVNLGFIGTQEELERAFTAAGWSGARPNSMTSGFKAVRAIVEGRGYPDAPMRTLLLNGREPDLTRQKSLNTFEKRDHLRIWRLAARWQGRTVWVAAATKDIATTLSIRPFGFTHEIEKDVDLERDKIVDDLAATGCVDAVANLSRPERVIDSMDYRKGVSTDSRVAVLVLNSCEAPSAIADDGAGDPHPGAWVRAIRRVVLTARNHFLRDNIVYRSGDAARLGIIAARKRYAGWRRDRRVEDEQLTVAEPDSDIIAVR